MRRACLLIALAVVPAVVGLDNELQDYDPPQYADVAARIVRTGEWLELRDSSGPFLNKPPMMMWAQATTMLVLGIGSVGARLPAFLFGLLAVLAVFLTGKELRSAQLGVLAAGLFGSSVAFHLMVADPKVDMPLTALTALAVWAALASRRRPALIWVGWLSAGAAVLSKGPIGLVIPVLAVAPEWLRQPPAPPAADTVLNRVLSLRPIRGLLLAALVTAPFYGTAALTGGSTSLTFHLWKQGVGRLTGASGWVNNTTPLFFTHTALWAFLPFAPLLLSALVRHGTQLIRDRRLPPALNRVPWWWLLGPFVVISLARYRLPQYVYWLAPPAALLAADELSRLTAPAARRWRAGYAALSAAGGVGALISLHIVFPAPLLTSVLWGATLLGVPLAAHLLARRLDDTWRTSVSAVGGVAPLLLFFHAVFHPSLLEYQPGRELAAAVRAQDPQGSVIPYLNTSATHSAAFYARRDVGTFDAEGIRQLVASGRSTVAVLHPGGAQALQAVGLNVSPIATYLSYPTSTPRGPFLLARSRPQTLTTLQLVALSPREAAPTWAGEGAAR